MRKIFIPAILILSFIGMMVSCVKTETVGKNDVNKKYIEAWISINYPSAQRIGYGVYVLDEKQGTGEEFKEDMLNTDDNEQLYYASVNYTSYSLDGTISGTTEASVAKKIGSYDKTAYYGPATVPLGKKYSNTGLNQAVTGMREGGYRKVLIPGWLDSSENYDSEEKYLNKVSGTNSIYEITLNEIIPDLTKWEIDSLESFTHRHMNGVDSTAYGFYQQVLVPGIDTTHMNKDTTIYINYIGRLLNGLVFDTNIADSAKVHGIYKTSGSYEPAEITMSEDYSSIAFGSGGSAITGFSYALSQMTRYEKSRFVFYSSIGYGSSGSGSSIPAYSPLMFDIQVVGKPNE